MLAGRYGVIGSGSGALVIRLGHTLRDPRVPAGSVAVSDVLYISRKVVDLGEFEEATERILHARGNDAEQS